MSSYSTLRQFDFSVTGDNRSPEKILKDIEAKKRRVVTPELLAAATTLRPEPAVDTTFHFIFGTDMFQDECLAVNILNIAQRKELKEPSLAACLLFAERYPQKELEYRKILFFHTPAVYIDRKESRENKTLKLLLLTDGPEGDRLELSRKSRGARAPFKNHWVFGFCF